jgi:hypothetical protein
MLEFLVQLQIAISVAIFPVSVSFSEYYHLSIGILFSNCLYEEMAKGIAMVYGSDRVCYWYYAGIQIIHQ